MAAYEAEYRAGHLSAEQWAEARDVLMKIEYLPVDEVKLRLMVVAQGNAAGEGAEG